MNNNPEKKEVWEMSYTASHMKKMEEAIAIVADRWEVRQLLIDLKELLDQKACSYKRDMDTRDSNEEMIALLEYLVQQFKGHIEVIELLRLENPDNWR